jgi:hypothetical protein
MLNQPVKMRIAMLLLIVSLVLALVSCKTFLEGFRSHTETITERTVTKRDTVWHTKADSATMRIVADVVALRKLIESLKQDGARTVRGTHNASLVMSVVGDTLVLDARCDSLAMELENALVTIETTRERNTELERTVTQVGNETKGVIPGWMKGTIYIILAALLALFAVYLLINKTLFKRL